MPKHQDHHDDQHGMPGFVRDRRNQDDRSAGRSEKLRDTQQPQRRGAGNGRSR